MTTTWYWFKDTEVVIPLASMVDMEAEKARLQKEYEEVKANVDRLETRLNDQAFISKAPPAVVKKNETGSTKARINWNVSSNN